MHKNQLITNIRKKKSFLCIGLDSDIRRIPRHLFEYENPVFEFNKQIVDATAEYAVAYKPNIAFYESEGPQGWEVLRKTALYIKTRYPDIFLIADAKRGDIGNTSKLYARAFFENMNFDAITLTPYMGSDSVIPFLDYDDKWVILLALTSNSGASDFQLFRSEKEGLFLYQKVFKKALEWSSDENLMFVVGASKADYLKQIREMAPNHFLLVPGIGAQGGNLRDTAKNGLNRDCGLLINSSRGIIFADTTLSFASTAAKIALQLKKEMELLLEKYV